MKTRDFRGFRFGKIHTSDLNLEVVSSSNRYEARMLPDATDTTVDIPGSDGQYYFGSLYKTREISCDVAFDNVTEEIYRKIRQLFATDKLQDLVFDEEPYKTWKAKLKGKPEFKSLCFTDKETKKRIYKGEGKLNFICYFPYAFGFDKYVVRAADYYMLNPPQTIICNISNNEDDIFFNTVDAQIPERWIPQDIKYHYNLNPDDYVHRPNGTELRPPEHQNCSGDGKQRGWRPNGTKPWKTGFPTMEQVQAGELYFDDGSILDVRNYWDNVPEWEDTAKLLTTPTLDYEQELMYMPQYSKTNFINMEMGYQDYSPMIGSRILVYNPGDLPIDWEIRINENKRGFWTSRNGGKFRISRYNVERLTIPQAVDWCGLKPYDHADEEEFKYGNRYFRRTRFDKMFLIRKIKEIAKIFLTEEEQQDEEKIAQLKRDIYEGHLPANKKWGDNENYKYEDWNTSKDDFLSHRTKDFEQWKVDLSNSFNLHLDELGKTLDISNSGYYEYLGAAHPQHCYYVEPIPKEKLSHFIKLFYWQTIFWRGDYNRPKKPYSLSNLDKLFKTTDGWVDSVSKDLIKKDDNGDYYATDAHHPFVEFLSQFYNIGEDGYITEKDNVNFQLKYLDLNWEEGVALADRYDELYELCITDEERNELYWKTLKQLFEKFIPMLPQGETFEDFFYNYINHPSEFFSNDGRDLDYGNDLFNAFKYPTWITHDYLEIDANQLTGVQLARQYLAAIGEDETVLFNKERFCYNPDLLADKKFKGLKQKLDKLLNKGDNLATLLEDSYNLNTEERILYSTENPYGMEFVYKPSKNIMNGAITKGSWFKLPPGWSVLCVEPIVDENAVSGKRWLDSRPFDWGYGGDSYGHKREVQQLFDYVFKEAETEFLKSQFNEKEIEEIMETEIKTDETHDKSNYFRFNFWYKKKIDNLTETDFFAKRYYVHKQQYAEYAFLKIINEIWQLISPFYSWTAEKGAYFDYLHDDYSAQEYDINNKPLRTINGNISDWWWYACNYLWANFPPVYWGAADLLNSLEIKYIPLFY